MPSESQRSPKSQQNNSLARYEEHQKQVFQEIMLKRQ